LVFWRSIFQFLSKAFAGLKSVRNPQAFLVFQSAPTPDKSANRTSGVLGRKLPPVIPLNQDLSTQVATIRAHFLLKSGR
jgi:hypothetical protein